MTVVELAIRLMGGAGARDFAHRMKDRSHNLDQNCIRK